MLNRSTDLYNMNYQHIGLIVEKAKAFNPNSLCHEIENYFKGEEIDSVCITLEDRVVGMITKNNLNKALATQYGRAIYPKREINLLYDEDFLSVDYHTPINIVSEKAMKRNSAKIYDAVVVLKNEKYYGMVSVKNLLEHSIKMENDYARELNPLTNIPGNRVINRVLHDVLSYSEDGTVIYFDLDNFKSYNDVYGFENGDKMIIMFANLLLETIKTLNYTNSFIGHIGGDDFVAVFDRTSRVTIKSIVCTIIEEFDKRILAFYNETDKQTGYILSEDRFGNTRKFNLTALSVACLMGNFKHISSIEQLAMDMAKLKKIVKKTTSSSYEIFQISELSSLGLDNPK